MTIYPVDLSSFTGGTFGSDHQSEPRAEGEGQDGRQGNGGDQPGGAWADQGRASGGGDGTVEGLAASRWRETGNARGELTWADTPLIPGPARPLQPLLIRAAVDLVPPEVARVVGLKPLHGLSSWQRTLIRTAARAADRLPLRDAPPAQACLRMGLPGDWLYR